MEPAPPRSQHDEVVCEGVVGENLAARALSLFRGATGWGGGGCAWGSTSAYRSPPGSEVGLPTPPAALRLAHAASGLGDEDLLHVLAGQLGADVPAQVSPGRWLATGAGELLEVLPDPRRPSACWFWPRQPRPPPPRSMPPPTGWASPAMRTCCGNVARGCEWRSSSEPRSQPQRGCCTTTCRRPPSRCALRSPRHSRRRSRWGAAGGVRERLGANRGWSVRPRQRLARGRSGRLPA